MKKISTWAAITMLVVTAASLWAWQSAQPDSLLYTKPAETTITLCGSMSFNWADTADATRILPGLGNLHYPVTTTSLKAQEFFEQGLRLVYAFNHWEAIQSFREAVRLDPNCAMAHWGLALAYGPNLNDINPKDRERIAFESIQKASALRGAWPWPERVKQPPHLPRLSGSIRW
jgi:hypothetical protein